MPILCNYYLTYRCNARCLFCDFGHERNEGGGSMAQTNDVLRNLPELYKIGVRFIDFTGGEPLLHPDVGLLLKAAKALRFRTSITTNALLYPKYAEQLRNVVDLLHFSLDSAEKDEHDRIRGVKCFDKVMESIAIARSLGEFPDILFTATNENFRGLPAVYDIARREKLVLLINPIFSNFNEQKLSTEAMDYIENLSRQPMVYMNPSFLTLRREGGNNPARPACKAVSRVIVISPENEILLPCFHAHSEKIRIEDDLFSAYASQRIHWHKRMEGRHAFCKGCEINCYFEPSFAYPLNRLSLATVPSKIFYGFNKYIRQPFVGFFE